MLPIAFLLILFTNLNILFLLKEIQKLKLENKKLEKQVEYLIYQDRLNSRGKNIDIWNKTFSEKELNDSLDDKWHKI